MRFYLPLVRAVWAKCTVRAIQESGVMSLLKSSLAHFSQDAERLRRFEQEARATGVLNHPNILGVYDVGTENGSPYLVTELLQGETLRKRLADGPLPMRKSMDYALQIAHGLSAAHEKGIIHRDLKPENIFITKEGRLKILDFGLAKLTHAEVAESKMTEAATRSHQTDTGVVMGTVLYMSPEQVRGEKVDHRSDIFAFGTILYEMISGKRPFHGDSQIEIMHAILKAEPPPLSESNKTIPPALEKIIQRCLEKDQDRRFQSTSDLAFALEALSSSSGAATTTPMQVRRASPETSAVFDLSLGCSELLSRDLLCRTKNGAINSCLPPNQQHHHRIHGHELRFETAIRTMPDLRRMNRLLFMMQIGTARLPKYFLRASEVRRLALLVCRMWNSFPFRLPANWRLLKNETLMQMPFAGGIPREILEGVSDADWSPDGKSLLVLRGSKIEFPIGKELYAGEYLVFNPRFSPNGNQVAFKELRYPGIGSISVMDLNGKKRKLYEADMSGIGHGLAWSPSGEEIWFISRPKKGNGSLLSSRESFRKTQRNYPIESKL